MVRTGHAMTMGDRKSVNESRDGRFNDSFSAVTFVLLEYWKKIKRAVRFGFFLNRWQGMFVRGAKLNKHARV